jgi:hypothetical protein
MAMLGNASMPLFAGSKRNRVSIQSLIKRLVSQLESGALCFFQRQLVGMVTFKDKN